jgi:hypothetical protein
LYRILSLNFKLRKFLTRAVQEPGNSKLRPSSSFS